MLNDHFIIWISRDKLILRFLELNGIKSKQKNLRIQLNEWLNGNYYSGEIMNETRLLGQDFRIAL